MFGQSKPAASLSSSLLARKGQARPAMRPQGFHGTALNLEDLGWNDMGDDAPPPAPVVPLTPAAALPPVAEAPVPPVLAERQVLREEFERTPEPAPIAAAPAPAPEPTPEPEPKPVAQAAPAPVAAAAAQRIARAVRAGPAKAAFTLRLDAERHLRLRLASASRNRSAQALVTEALDAYIATLPEVEGLATQLAAKTTSGGKS
jgi:hypothetical protein